MRSKTYPQDLLLQVPIRAPRLSLGPLPEMRGGLQPVGLQLLFVQTIGSVAGLVVEMENTRSEELAKLSRTGEPASWCPRGTENGSHRRCLICSETRVVSGE